MAGLWKVSDARNAEHVTKDTTFLILAEGTPTPLALFVTREAVVLAKLVGTSVPMENVIL